MTSKEVEDIAIAAVRQYIKVYGGSGPLHIVIGDDNYETEYIVWCMRNSIPEIEDDEEYVFNMDVALALLNVKESKRLGVLMKSWRIK